MLRPLNLLIAGLDPAIHDAFEHHLLTDSRAWLVSMDARVKPAHDE
jgi:hypothetical protein